MEEWIKPVVFRRRIGISGPAYRNARKADRLNEKKVGNEILVEWYSSRHKFIETSKFPMRYTEAEIQKRISKKRPKEKNLYRPPEDGLEKNNDNKKNDDVSELDKAEDLLESEEIEKDDEFSPSMSKREAEAVKQHYLAKQAKLKFLKDAGVLMETTQVIKEWESLAIQVRKLIMAVPDRVSELYASMSSAIEIEKDLKRELTNCLVNLKYEIKKSKPEENDREGDK